MTVTLRPVEPADLPVFFEHQNDPVACERVGWTPRDRASFDAHWARIMAGPDNLLRTVVVDGAVAGNVVSWTNGDRRDLGYWLGREFWGRGVGRLAVEAYLDVERQRPLYAEPLATNAASVAVLRRCGFVEAGRDGDYLVFVREA